MEGSSRDAIVAGDETDLFLKPVSMLPVLGKLCEKVYTV